MLNEEKTSCFDEILLAVSKFPEPVQNICKLLAVNPATSVTILGNVYSHLHGIWRRGFDPGWITKGLATLQWTDSVYIVRGPESETLPPPPSGIFAHMYHFKASPKGIWKMHVCSWLVGGCGCAATFFSSAKSHRLPTPRGELTSSETPLQTKITLKVI